MESMFRVGDKVKAVAFTDCFGKPVAERSGLVVSEVRQITGYAPHTRIKAMAADGIGYAEGAERFFAPEMPA